MSQYYRSIDLNNVPAFQQKGSRITPPVSSTSKAQAMLVVLLSPLAPPCVHFLHFSHVSQVGFLQLFQPPVVFLVGEVDLALLLLFLLLLFLHLVYTVVHGQGVPHLPFVELRVRFLILSQGIATYFSLMAAISFYDNTVRKRITIHIIRLLKGLSIVLFSTFLLNCYLLVCL